MRRVRLTYHNAYHHIINRGINRENIFINNDDKIYFLKILHDKITHFRIRLLCFCIMDNHYHINIQNTSSKLSEFMKQVNGEYGTYYRKMRGGKGYVFQNRFKSTLIEDEKYLISTIIYILLNPVKAGIMTDPFNYNWSSINEYFSRKSDNITDFKFVEGLFQTKKELYSLLYYDTRLILIPETTRFGNILGDEEFISTAIKKYDRRENKSSLIKRRITDNKFSFKKSKKIIEEFEKKHNIKINNININTLFGKKLRSKILVQLKEDAGLKYSEINKHHLFQDLKYSSLRQIYKRAREKN